ncbi:DUF3732 domain-containing protein [Oceanobacillus sp. CF4.6]|uniref:DUF3732 domain-containing protein n=1 Tax=Oceanobacillus sp. CF4.6 TaxID=3373080 RepID=UPI003EE63EF1
MRFNINKILLWLNNGKIREIKFEKNKINVITGDSGTGKSEIISIIDYCLFGSRADITDEIINENVTWYGVNFHINNNLYTLGRGRIDKREVSKEYFFHADGHIPKHPTANNTEKLIKKIIDNEFNITERTVFPFGGKNITLGSKISPRYFLMFNTLSGDTIDHSEVFFDKQNVDRYRDALINIFDLAVSIETEENLLQKEKLNVLKSELKKLKRKQNLIDKEMDVFNENINELSKKAKEFNLIDYDISDSAELMNKLNEINTTYKEESIDINLEKINKLKNEKNKLIRKIRNLKMFNLEIGHFKKLQKNTLDSLKPVQVLNESYKLLELPDLDLLINSLQDEYELIKQNNKGRSPFNFNVDNKIKEYEEKVKSLNSEIFDIPINSKTTKNEIDKLIFIGEVRTKLELYGRQWGISNQENDLDEKITNLESQINEVELIEYHEKRNATLRLLDELVQTYLDKSGDALDNYKGYKSSFNYKEKKLELRKPRSAFPSKVGSSSNHMFLHLCLFLGLHELIISQKSPYVPQWLIMDQPSRPYFGEEKESKVEKLSWEKVKRSDKGKITIAMQLLDYFINYVIKILETDFQVILLEHIPKSIWIDARLEHFHLVEEFKNGNALIRFDENNQPY